jgi:hypothetical protein
LFENAFDLACEITMQFRRDHVLAMLGRAALTGTLAWPACAHAQSVNNGQHSGNSFDWLCRGLPQDRIWGPPPTSPADLRKCAGTLYLGFQNDTNQAAMFGLARFVPPYAYHSGDSYLISGSLSRTIAEIGPYISYEIETGAGQRFGSLHEEEVWLALYAR